MTTTTFTNRYAGTCEYCQAHVAKDQGIYTWGVTCCSDEHYKLEVARHDARIDERDHDIWVQQRDLFIPNFITELGLDDAKVAKLVTKITEGRTTNIADLTSGETPKMLRELHKIQDRRNNTKRINEHKLANRCPRCEGQGGADKWNATQWTCYECGGSGKYSRSK